MSYVPLNEHLANQPITCEACHLAEADGHYFINQTGVFLCDECLRKTGKTGEE